MINYVISKVFSFASVKYTLGDFPAGLVVKNSPCNPGHVDLILGQGAKIPHAKTKTWHSQIIFFKEVWAF